MAQWGKGLVIKSGDLSSTSQSQVSHGDGSELTHTAAVFWPPHMCQDKYSHPLPSLKKCNKKKKQILGSVYH